MSDTASILSHHNKNYTDRFVILKDRIFDMNLNNQVRVIHTNKYYKELTFIVDI